LANAPAKAGPFVQTLSRLGAWVRQALQTTGLLPHGAVANRRRIAAVVAAASLLATFTGLAWSVLVRNAAEADDHVTLGDALLALDEGDYEVARSLVYAIRQREAPLPEDYGGTAFILGAIRALEAEAMTAPRRKAAYFIASRYLKEAVSHGFPNGREAEGQLLLGLSLNEAERFEEAIPALHEALRLNPQQQTALHRMLATANLHAPEGDLMAAEEYCDLALSDRTLAPHERAAAILQRGEILLRLGDLAELDRLLGQLPAEIRDRPVAKMLSARLQMAKADQLDEAAPGADADSLQGAVSLRRSAIADLRELQTAASQDSEISLFAQYLIGQCYARLPEETDAALDQFSRLATLYPESPEGIAASLAQAELLQQLGQIEQAVAAYGRTLKAVGDTTDYHNPWLSVSMLHKRILAANGALVADGQFATALAMIEQFTPAFDRVSALLQRAHVRRTWGERLLEDAATKPAEEAKAMARQGRTQFRHAARTFEEVSTLRIAEPEYPDDLWRAAENYLDGRCASHAARVLSKYLAREAVARRPQALAKLGQALLTVGDVDRSTTALEECIELYDRDAAVYDARNLCARAHMEKSDYEKAEQLFRANLNAEGLTPASREWRESLLLLGQLYHAQGRFTDAIRLLQEYVERYGDEPDAMLARYLVAQSNRHAAKEPLDRLAKSVTENERIKHRTHAMEFLTAAMEHFSYVQRELTLKGAVTPLDSLERAVLRNCYLLRGDVLFSMREYEQALDVFRNASSVYQNDPIVLGAYLQIAWCHRRLNQLEEARGAIEQAKMVLGRLPEDAEFTAATGMERQHWNRVLNDISQW
jgi:tetratricopeptide (TPR) repeat protein